MYRDVMSMVKISLSWPEKLKSRKIFSACVLSLMYDGKGEWISYSNQFFYLLIVDLCENRIKFYVRSVFSLEDNLVFREANGIIFQF